VDEYTSRFVDQVAQFYEQEGYARITGQVLARLLLSAEPMALRDLVTDLAVSKASISTDARRLERQGIIERVRRPGDRRAYYRIAEDLPERIMALRVDRLRRFKALIGGAVSRTPSGQTQVKIRLAELGRAHSHMIAAMTEMLAEWREPASAALKRRAK
jgi:DNA-binding MarR family transcriptional regulator